MKVSLLSLASSCRIPGVSPNTGQSKWLHSAPPGPGGGERGPLSPLPSPPLPSPPWPRRSAPRPVHSFTSTFSVDLVRGSRRGLASKYVTLRQASTNSTIFPRECFLQLTPFGFLDDADDTAANKKPLGYPHTIVLSRAPLCLFRIPARHDFVFRRMPLLLSESRGVGAWGRA